MNDETEERIGHAPAKYSQVTGSRDHRVQKIPPNVPFLR